MARQKKRHKNEKQNERQMDNPSRQMRGNRIETEPEKEGEENGC